MAERHEYPTAAAFVPDGGDLAALARAALGCRGCDLYQDATQTVFGEGTADAAVVLIGEQLSWRSGPDSGELTVVPTVHPSSVIRVQDGEREEAYAGLVKDLRVAAALLTSGAHGTG